MARRLFGAKSRPIHKIPYHNRKIKYYPHIHEEWEHQGDTAYKSERRLVSYWNLPQLTEGDRLYSVTDWE